MANDEAEPTPRPWVIADSSGGTLPRTGEWCDSAVRRIEGANGEHVCGTCDGCNSITPTDAELICRAVNAHETLVTTLQRCRKSLENLRDVYGFDNADMAAELGIIDAALVLASKESK